MIEVIIVLLTSGEQVPVSCIVVLSVSVPPWLMYLSNILKNRQIALDFPRDRVILSFLF